MGGFGSGGHNAKGRGTVCTVTWSSGANLGVRAGAGERNPVIRS